MDRGARWGYSLWGCKESDTTKQLTHTHTHIYIYTYIYIYIQDIMYIGKDSLQPHWEGPYQATSPKQTSAPISDTQL